MNILCYGDVRQGFPTKVHGVSESPFADLHVHIMMLQQHSNYDSGAAHPRAFIGFYLTVSIRDFQGFT